MKVNRRTPGANGRGGARRGGGRRRRTGSRRSRRTRPRRSRPRRTSARTSTVRSGCRRCRVQIAVAPGAHRRRQPAHGVLDVGVEMLPKTPHTSTRSAGTAPAYTLARRRVRRTRPRRPAARARRRVAASSESSSTSRPVTSLPRGWSASTPSRSRPSPAHMLITRIGPGGMPVERVANAAAARRAAAAPGATLGSSYSRVPFAPVPAP